MAEKPTYDGLTPVLSKVKIGDKYYYLKDKDARTLLDKVVADYLTSVDKTELNGLITALAGRVTTIEGDYVKAADLADAVKDEADRAKEAEEALAGRLDVIEGEGEGSIKKAVADEADARDAAIETAIKALDVTDTAVTGQYVSAVSEVDGKIQVTRTALPTAAEYTIVKQATAEEDMASTYYLTKDGNQVGAKINIPKDQFLKEAKFFATQAAAEAAGKTVPTGTEFPALYFLFEQTAGESETWIPVKSLVDVYTEGNGIDITDNVISAVTKSGDKYIEVTADGIASKGIDTAIADAVAAEAAIARAAEQANATAVAEKADQDDLDALNTRVTTAEGKITTIEGKPAYDITATQISNWDGEVGAKAAVEAEVTRATAAEATLTANLAAEVTRADTAEKANTKAISDEVARAQAAEALKEDKANLGDLAYADTASGTVPAQTISGIKATGNISGTAEISMDYTSTDATLTKGEYTPAGSIDVTLSGATFNKITSVGSMPVYVKESVTGGKATVIDTTKFDGGAAATFTQGSKATLTAQTTAKFANKVLKPSIDTTDNECLVFNYVDATVEASAFGDAVTDRGTFTANGDDTFDGGSAASIKTGFYTAGSDVEYTSSQWTDGVVPTMESNTVAVATKSFTGTKVTDYVTGVTYDKANKPTGDVTVNNVSLDVGAITVTAQTVTVFPDAE